jgi:hypothetical protein
MSQKIFYNLTIYILIIYMFFYFIFNIDIIIVLNKYIDFNIDSFTNIKTFDGLNKFNPKAPSFKSGYDIEFINFYKRNHQSIDESEIIKLCYFLKTLVSLNVDTCFTTPSDTVANDFTEDEIHKIKNVILAKLNSGTINFYNIIFQNTPIFYLNFNGKEIDPIIFYVDCKLGNIKIYINIDIRNDIYQNKEYIIINKIKPLVDKEQVLTIDQKHLVQNNLVNKFQDDTLVFNNNSEIYAFDYYKK